MAKRIFITATNTDIGKTYATKLLLKEFASRGFRIGVIKPFETGVVNGVYLDGNELLACAKELNSELKELSVEDIVPLSYSHAAAPFVASEGKKIEFEKIDIAIEKVEKFCDILFIEGAGGLFVPLDEQFMVIDLITLYKASALLVTHCSLGCINDTLLSKKALEDRNIPHIVAFNCRDNDKNFSSVSEPYFLKTDFKVLKVAQNIDTICDVLYNL